MNNVQWVKQLLLKTKEFPDSVVRATCMTLFDVFLQVKEKRCEEHRSSSNLPGLLSLTKAFVSEWDEEL